MFRKIVLIEPVGFAADAMKALGEYAGSIVRFGDSPVGDDAVIARIGDADAALLTYTSSISGRALRACPNLRYVGMCNSLYSEESANVDIRTARELGIDVRGIRDYGDRGVAEYVVSELVRYLHGYGEKRFAEMPVEISGLKIGIVGMGTTGTLVAETLAAFGADLRYFSRTRKADVESRGVPYLPLHDLLGASDVICTCLTKNTVVLREAEFRALGNHKILFNTSIGPSFDPVAARDWLAEGSNELFCDSAEALGGAGGILAGNPHVNAQKTCSGITRQAYERLGEKALANIRDFLSSNGGASVSRS